MNLEEEIDDESTQVSEEEPDHHGNEEERERGGDVTHHLLVQLLTKYNGTECEEDMATIQHRKGKQIDEGKIDAN